MPDAEGLSDALLEACPAVQWIADSTGVFQKIYGDPLPLFGKSAADLVGRRPTALWCDRIARTFAGEILHVRERTGDSLWNISLFPIRSGDAVRFAGALARNVTAWSTGEAHLRATVFRALDTQEAVRKQVSRFLHDSIGQTLTALGLRLDLLRMDLESGAGEIPARVEEVQQILGQTMEDVRRYVHEINPSTVDRSGLGPAIERLSAGIRERFQGVLRVHVDAGPRLDAKIASALYRVAQEAVENALTHSGCCTLEITVQSTRTGTSIEVRDDGRGFDSGEVPGVFRGLGLMSMEHYAAQAGLELTVASSRDAGTRVRASAKKQSE